ncbi:MAG TPA: hypothetical protein VNS49_16175 [Streptomyces sp.]|nr:hypothetical protein [Streptomyces sp.]
MTSFWTRTPEQRDQAEKAKAERAERTEKAKAARAERRAEHKAEREALKAWRQEHPAEKEMNSAAMMRMWPSSERGVTSLGPVAGAQAEFFTADAHKAWTATRLVGGAVTMGASLAAGRKNKGAAAINITFPNGVAKSYAVKPDSTSLQAANQYVTAFKALSAQLLAEAAAAE